MNPYYIDSGIEIYNGNCLELMPLLPANSIDCCITDSPYGISNEVKITRGRNKMKFGGSDISHNFGEWDSFKDNESFMRFTFSWMDEVFRVLAEDACLITFFDRDKINHLSDYARSKGFIRRNYIYYCKSNPVPQARKVNWQSSVEVGVILTRGKKICNYKEGQHKEYWELPIVGGDKRTKHPTQKPIEIFSDLVRWWSSPGLIVLDPFMGSGTTGVAAKLHKRQFIGFEVEQKYCDISKLRLQQDSM